MNIFEAIHLLKNYVDEFEQNRAPIINEIVRKKVANALSGAGYDINTPFISTVISRFKVVCVIEGNSSFDLQVTHDFDPKTKIETKWTNKDGNEYTASITSGEIVEMLNSGRRAYSVSSQNTEHGMLAISSPVGQYDPSNKGNVIVKSGKVNIPAREGSQMFVQANLVLDMWVEKEHARVTALVIAAVEDWMTKVSANV